MAVQVPILDLFMLEVVKVERNFYKVFMVRIGVTSLFQVVK